MLRRVVPADTSMLPAVIAYELRYRLGDDRSIRWRTGAGALTGAVVRGGLFGEARRHRGARAPPPAHLGVVMRVTEGGHR